MPSTLTWCAVTGVNSDRVDSSAARWNTVSTSYCERMRSSSAVSRIEPVNSRATSGASVASSGLMSRVTTDRWPDSVSLVMRPWPISPPAPVMRTTGLRMNLLF